MVDARRNLRALLQRPCASPRSMVLNGEARDRLPAHDLHRHPPKIGNIPSSLRTPPLPLNPTTRPEMESRRRPPAKRIPPLRLLLLFLLPTTTAVEVLSKSKLESCARASESDQLQCHKKVVINLAVPSGSSGGEASIVAELVEVEENDTQKMQAIRSPPVITINKSAAYALYELTYIRV